MGIIGSYEGYVSSPFEILNYQSGDYSWGSNLQEKGSVVTLSPEQGGNMESYNTGEFGCYATAYISSSTWKIYNITRTKQSINLTDYKYIKFSCVLRAYNSTSIGYLGISTNPNLTSFTFNASVSQKVESPYRNDGKILQTLLTLDISNFNGSYFIYSALKCDVHSTSTGHGSLQFRGEFEEDSLNKDGNKILWLSNV